MRQNELLLDLLTNYREYAQLDPYFTANPSYINDPVEYVLKRLQESKGIERKEIVDTKRLYDGLSEATLDLYCESLITGFETGVDLAMTIMGYRPLYNVLPESQKERDRINNVVDSVTELVNSAGADKVAKLISSLGYSSVAELIIETEK